MSERQPSRVISLKQKKLSLRVRQIQLPELMAVYDSFMEGIGNVYEKYKSESEGLVNRQKIFSKTDAALKISEGEIPEISQKEIYSETKNEILQMENAFAEMALSVNELSKTAEQIASGDLSATVKIRSEKDILGNAIAKMVEDLKNSLEDLHTNSMNLALGMSDCFTVISESSQGNINIKASEETGDDLLNQLGKVTNNMIAEYKKLSECVEEVIKGNLDVQVHVRSEKDILGIGFRHMLEHLKKTSEELHIKSMNLAMGLTDYFFVLQQVASGDPTVRANEDTGDDLLNQLGKATNSMISSMNQPVKGVI